MGYTPAPLHCAVLSVFFLVKNGGKKKTVKSCFHFILPGTTALFENDITEKDIFNQIQSVINYNRER